MKHPARNACGACCLKTEGLTVTRDDLTILKDVNLHVHCGELTAIIGPNGAGKTTLFEALLGMSPHEGKIIYTDAHTGQERTPRFGYVPQSLNMERLAPITVMDFLSADRTRRPVFLKPSSAQRDAVLAELARVGAHALADRRIGALSGGEAQRVMLSLALVPPPDLLLLDEPVSGMDASGLEKFYGVADELRRSLDMSVLLITHDFGMVRRYADRVILLDQTILAQGTAAEVFAGAAFRAAFPGVRPEI
ncbi:MAG: ATP-binding cassette domain-containing protein [Oscillospiraceae bacterium]|jgi:zinc transport system ATP-binding protein|nr:ATP-binding cassette domain-containing protein [Oscillospiraceae bacterium]